MKKKLGEAPLIHPTAKVEASTLGVCCEVMEGCRLSEVEMGDYSYSARFAELFCTTVGKFANIAGMTRINPGNHPIWRASLHHFMYRSAQYWDDAEDDGAFFDWRRAHRVEIGHDTWIGHGAVVLAGRKVGTGAVVGAGAVVSRDVAPYTVVAGVPAAPVKPRLPAPVAERMMALAWWDWDHARLRAALDDFRTLSAEAFLEKHHG